METKQQPTVFFSIVSPVYRAAEIVPLLVSEIKKEVEQITSSYEIILVEDGSPDASWDAIRAVANVEPKVKGIKLSRNFGQHYAITAGLEHAAGEWVVVMDCDLQDKPKEIPALYNKAKEGFDVVLARRAVRNDTFLKKLYSKTFYWTLGKLTGVQQDASVANFGIYHSKVINSVNLLKEPIRYFPTMVKWVGFKRTELNVSHGEREIGTTSYNLKRMLRLAKDIILANSERPIYAFVIFGFIVSFISLIVGVVTVVEYFKGVIDVAGYTSLIISIWFLSGIIIMILGVIGLYLGKTFEGVKRRPIYIVDEILNP